MSRTYSHVPFNHAFRDYKDYYARERMPLDPAERSLYWDAGPEFPREGDKHWSKTERREWPAVNRSGRFTRTMAHQRIRAEIAAQLADEQADEQAVFDEVMSYLADSYADFEVEVEMEEEEDFSLYINSENVCDCRSCLADWRW